jgi:hypothetical protein
VPPIECRRAQFFVKKCKSESAKSEIGSLRKKVGSSLQTFTECAACLLCERLQQPPPPPPPLLSPFKQKIG